MKRKNITLFMLFSIFFTFGGSYAQSGNLLNSQITTETQLEHSTPPVVINCTDLQPIHAIELSQLVSDESKQEIEKNWPGKTILRNEQKFSTFSLGQSFTLNYEITAVDPGTYKILCNTTPELPIESIATFQMVVDDPSQTHNYSFQFRCDEPGDYCIIVSVQPQKVINLRGGGNHVLYFRMDESGARLIDAEGMLYENKIHIWQKYYKSEPELLKMLPSAIIGVDVPDTNITMERVNGPLSDKIKVYGTITYQDYDLSGSPVKNAVIEIWDDDFNDPFGISNDDLLATISTDDSGYFEAEVNGENDPAIYLMYKYSDIYIKVYAKNSSELIVLNDTGWNIKSGTSQDVKGDTKKDMDMANKGLNSNENKIFTLFDHIQKSQDYFTSVGLDKIGGQPPKLTIKYPHTGQTTFIPQSTEAEILLTSGDIVSPFTEVPSIIGRMYGIFAMWHLFDKQYPLTEIVGHPINQNVNRDVSWINGWADFFAIACRDVIYNRPDGTFYEANGVSLNLKNTDWMTPVRYDYYDDVPGRVAGALYDLFDSADDTTEQWDNYSGNRDHTKILETMKDGGKKDIFQDFFYKYISKYYSTNLPGRANVYGACVQNGINYDRTAPSVPGTPTDDGDFSTAVVTFYWSASVDDESGIAGYHLKIWEIPSERIIFDDLVGNVLSKTVTGAHGQTLYAQVCAYNGVGTKSDWSGISDGITIDNTPPSIPGTPTDEGEYTASTEVTFNWTAAEDNESGIVDYQLQVGTASGDSNIFNGWIGNVLTKTVTGSIGQTLYARVKAKNGAGLIGIWSGSSDGITIGYPFSITIEAETMQNRKPYYGSPCENGWRLTHHDHPIYEDVEFPADMLYKFTITAKAEIAGGAAPWLNVQIGDVFKGNCEIDSPEWKEYSFITSVTAGVHRLSLTFLNDWWNQYEGDRNLLLDKVVIVNHFGDLPDTYFTFEAENMSTHNHTDPDPTGEYMVLNRYYSYVAHTMFFEQQELDFEIIAKADSANGAWPQMNLWIDNSIKFLPVENSTPMSYLFNIKEITPGEHLIKIDYKNDSWSSGRVLYIDKLIIHTQDGALLKPANEQLREEPIVAIPEAFALGQNYPNPFNPDTYIDYQIPVDCHVVIKIMNMLGQEIKTLVNENKTAGFYTIYWDGRDNRGNPVVTGVYLYQIKAGSVVFTKKMAVLK
jgi:hypothetical protein